MALFPREGVMSRLNRFIGSLLILLVPFALWLADRVPAASRAPGRAGEHEYLFCFWNVENLFDDQREDHPHVPDREYDAWFVRDPEARKLKYDHLSSAIVKLNHGKGPDILALAELESERAAELLRDALNAKLHGNAAPYKGVLYKDPHGGRHIANAIITRLPVAADRTQLHGRRLRVLEGHIREHGHDLVVLATHWTSHVSDAEGEDRDHYGDVCYGVFKAMYRSNPKVDFLVCGDFNDPPDDDSVRKHLHAVAPEEFRRGGPDPLLHNLFADKVGGKHGTHYYRGKWHCFDQICVSPGLLDNEGWSCDPASARIVDDLTADEKGRPHRFGNEHDKAIRGWSDHFPVTVRLRVAP
jgi:endonuclease/exonuclease/phosphatase family metal-dependent hydrolase